MICIEEGLVAIVLASLMIILTLASSLVAYFLLPTIEGNLQKSKALLDTLVYFKYGGMLGKSVMCAVISLVFLVPGVFAARGFIDLNEVKQFPRSLKLKLVIPWYGLYILFFLSACFWYAVVPGR